MELRSRALVMLSERRHFLVRRHGLDGEKPSTLEELAEEHGTTSREGIREIRGSVEKRLG